MRLLVKTTNSCRYALIRNDAAIKPRMRMARRGLFPRSDRRTLYSLVGVPQIFASLLTEALPSPDPEGS